MTQIYWRCFRTYIDKVNIKMFADGKLTLKYMLLLYKYLHSGSLYREIKKMKSIGVKEARKRAQVALNNWKD